MEVESVTGQTHITASEIDLYLDGELLQRNIDNFEEHLPACRPCRDILRQRQHLHLAITNFLGFSFALPAGFSQSTASAASNILSGLERRPRIRRDGLGLILFAIALYAGSKIVPSPPEVIASVQSLFPTALTATIGSVSFMVSWLESLTILLLRFFVQ